MNTLHLTLLPINPLPTNALKWSIAHPTASMIVSALGIIVVLIIIGIMIHSNKKNN